MEYFKNKILCTLSVMLLLLTVQTGYASHSTGEHRSHFSKIIGFGDSLTDVGNVAGIIEPGFPPLTPGYFEQTHFSDGPLWIEWVSNFLHLELPTPGRGNTTTLMPLPNGTDWAWGGAEAAAGTDQPPSVTEPIPNLLLQVQTYLDANVPDRHALYSIWAGVNNLLIGGQSSPEAASAAVQAVISAIQMLEDAGAKNFIIFNLYDLGDTPFIRAEGPESVAAASFYTTTFATDLRAALKPLKRHLARKEGRIFFVDINTEFLKIVDTVNAGGSYTPDFFVPGPKPIVITNVTDEALDVFLATGRFPTNYWFWDDVHPTTQGHQVVAGLVLQALKVHHHKHKKNHKGFRNSSSH
jgi:phospholipase/lecithinase/hemolysin